MRPSVGLQIQGMILLQILLLWVTCADSPPSPVTAQVGSSVFLPCTVPSDVENPYIKWKKQTSVFVFEGDGKEVLQGDGYKGRVDVPNLLKKGDCSLEIKKVQRSDEGEYKCFLMGTKDTSTISHVNLSVEEPTENQDKAEEHIKPTENQDKTKERSNVAAAVILSVTVSVLTLCFVVIII